MKHEFQQGHNVAIMFDPPDGFAYIQSDDGETPAGWASWDEMLNFCSDLVTTHRNCAGCVRFIDYPLTKAGGWCNRGTLGQPTAPDFFCAAWRARGADGLDKHDRTLLAVCADIDHDLQAGRITAAQAERERQWADADRRNEQDADRD